ncbi:MAG: hypothetical protein RL432_166 [Bacteroidota bacterium]|jgi:hypothetical protein
MTRKAHGNIFSFLLATLFLVVFSPLDYLNLDFAFIHFWLTIIYGVFLLIKFSEQKEIRKKRIIGSVISLPIVALLSLYVYVVSPNNEVEINHVPNSKMIVTNQFYTLFMMGNPRMDITIGYPILFNRLMWRINSYTKHGEGENEEELSKYELPKGIKIDDYGLFILEDENYLFQWGDEKVYKIKKKE